MLQLTNPEIRNEETRLERDTIGIKWERLLNGKTPRSRTGCCSRILGKGQIHHLSIHWQPVSARQDGNTARFHLTLARRNAGKSFFRWSSPNHRIVCRPALPEFLSSIELSEALMGSAKVDLRFERSNGAIRVHSLVAEGSLEITSSRDAIGREGRAVTTNMGDGPYSVLVPTNKRRPYGWLLSARS